MSPEAAVTVYTLGGCAHCESARSRLRRRGVAFEEVRGDGDPDFARRLYELTGRLSVPQIVLRGEPVGGASELARLDRAGVLAARVAGLGFPRLILRRRLSPWRIARWLATVLLGGRCSPWRYDVELVDRDGTVLERSEAGPEAEALVRLEGEPGRETRVPRPGRVGWPNGTTRNQRRWAD